MKAVILAAGRGTRMMPLTKNTPKPLLKINNKAILDHILESLPDEIGEVIIVINYLGHQIIEHLTGRYPDKKIVFVWQKETNGPAMALKLVEPLLGKEKFLVMFADDLHSKKAIKQCLSYDLAILVKKSDHPERFGVVSIKKPNVPRGTLGEIKNIVEKPEKPETNLVNVGVQVLDSRIFNYKAVKHSNGEYYLTNQINQLARDCPVKAVKTDFWLPIGYPEDLGKAERMFHVEHPL
jgi:NDP-sugar pyrophosphorylase family protein